ncbi:NADP-dependent oxidoreductase [Actinokineospora globicatena]|uniref:NADP-dependent oxidoreductase n=1 Tax=Actinokineospora globicatena TaxID=103729 RepID=UPI0020A5F127|nr:NADP-dependent oxidoreductase [Actinokineospora globicatena]MCP2303442.1 NADPH:quinone reductase [Actinokineospora globicatena]GLW79424.1 NADPH:quinone reductase [Actinokineospora globicatena]GLW86166.1 NADPH:quinone reductase [Actinokineospora globicatena]
MDDRDGRATAAAGTMTAVGQRVLGGPDVLRSHTRPRPRPGPGEVLVRVLATSLNPTDWVHRRVEGFLGPIRRDDPPRVLGWDLSGVVAEVGFGATYHDVGDPVFGLLPYPCGHGAAAEYAVAPARALARKPVTVSHAQAAAISLVGVTAWQALVETAHLRPGHRVLVHAAAGGVGHAAVQIAAGLGAHVVATAGAAHHDFVAACGACQVVDYPTTPFEDVVRDIDIVLDTVGGDYPRRSARTLRDGVGTIVSLVLDNTERITDLAGVRHRLMLVESSHDSISRIEELVADSLLAPRIEAEFPLERAAEGHRAGETGHVAGKVVLTV